MRTPELYVPAICLRMEGSSDQAIKRQFEQMTEQDGKEWYSAEAATFGDRLAGAREAMGLGQSDFARKLGVAVRSIQAWEEDRSEPRGNRLQMISGMLNVSMPWLLTGVGEGLDGPHSEAEMSGDLRMALEDLARMRAKALALAQDMGHLEKRLRKLGREGAI
jgi:transcriptional regulator with XRE-family HTH domain